MTHVVKEAHKYHTSFISGIPENMVIEVNKGLEKVDDFDFNVFEFDKLVEKKLLFCVLTFILNKYNFIKDLLVEKNYINFINEVTSGYNRKITYHNDLHATDVLQTSYILISKGNLYNVRIISLNPY